MKISIFLLCSIVFVLMLSCRKEANEKFNWTIYDYAGNPIAVITDKTETELLSCTTCGTFGGLTGVRLGDAIGCLYDKQNSPKVCVEMKPKDSVNYSGNYCGLTLKISKCLYEKNGTLVRQK